MKHLLFCANLCLFSTVGYAGSNSDTREESNSGNAARDNVSIMIEDTAPNSNIKIKIKRRGNEENQVDLQLCDETNFTQSAVESNDPLCSSEE